MIAFAGMLIGPAKEAGMKIPIDADNFNPKKYPHFDIFCKVQLGAPMPWATAHWENARLIASLSDKEIKTITYPQLMEKGLAIGNSRYYQ